MSLPSFSQIDTKIASSDNDSVVILPKKLVTFMVKDLVQADGDREQLVILNETLVKRDAYIAKQDSLTAVYKKRLASCEATMDEYSKIDDTNQKSIQSLTRINAKYKRQRNAFKILAGILLVGIAIK